MARADNLRRRAELSRRAASHPTEGGKKTDRILLLLAERLEREAAGNEEQVTSEGAASLTATGRTRPNRKKRSST